MAEKLPFGGGDIRRSGGFHGEFHGTGFCGIVDIE